MLDAAAALSVPDAESEVAVAKPELMVDVPTAEETEARAEEREGETEAVADAVPEEEEP